MPQLIFKGLKKEDITVFSKILVDELANIVGSPRDYFTLEVPDAAYIFDGKEVAGSPMIQVNWFDRGQAIQDQTAAAITRHVHQAGYPQVEIFFLLLEKSGYYENGAHY